MQLRDVWSLSLGRWWNLQIRLHIFFVLFGVFTCYLAWQEKNPEAGEGFMPLALVSMGLLFFSVLIHELGHYFAATRLGGHVDVIVLVPIGGLRPVRIPNDPQSELLATLAGPTATLALGLFSMLCAIMFQPEVFENNLSLFNPFAADEALGRTEWFPLIFRLSLWINGWLFVLNLIPAFPFVGGRAMAAMLRVMRPQITPQRAISLVATFARLVSIGLFVAAFVFHEGRDTSGPPLWLGLMLLSVFVFFSARVEEHQFEIEEEDDELFGYDFSQGYTSLERSTEPTAPQPGAITRWLEKRKAKQEALRLQREADEDREADKILARLHEVGMDGLSPRERNILKRVSERLRAREKE